MHVDDIPVTNNQANLIARINQFLHSQMKIKDLGRMKYFLGLEIARSSTDIFFNQRKYALDRAFRCETFFCSHRAKSQIA